MTDEERSGRVVDLLKSKIDEALVAWAHEQAKLISVNADHGKITLGGLVASSAAERAVVAALRQIPNVTKIEDRLCIVPHLMARGSEPDRPWR